MPEDDYFLPVTDIEQEKAAEVERQAASARAIESISDPRERELVEAVDHLLSTCLGSGDGYIPSAGAPKTRRLQAALSAYGITPDHGASIGMGLRLAR